MLGAALRLFLLEFVAVHESGYGPSRHVSTRSLTVAFGGLCCKTLVETAVEP